MQPENLMDKGVKCFKNIKKKYSSTNDCCSDEDSDPDLVSYTMSYRLWLKLFIMVVFRFYSFWRIF